MSNIIKLNENDIIEMKKPHPCGGVLFRILRTGSDVRIVCVTCGRDLTMERIKLEKSIKSIKTSENGN